MPVSTLVHVGSYRLRSRAGGSQSRRPDPPPDEAIGIDALDEVVSATARGLDPPPEDVLLADAIAAVTEAPSAMWKYERRDTARAVLLAAIAADVKIKGTIRREAPEALREMLDVILDNPRDVSIATGQFLDKPMRAALGISLRESNAQLFKDVTNDLFPPSKSRSPAWL